MRISQTPLGQTLAASNPMSFSFSLLYLRASKAKLVSYFTAEILDENSRVAGAPDKLPKLVL